MAFMDSDPYQRLFQAFMPDKPGTAPVMGIPTKPGGIPPYSGGPFPGTTPPPDYWPGGGPPGPVTMPTKPYPQAPGLPSAQGLSPMLQKWFERLLQFRYGPGRQAVNPRKRRRILQEMDRPGAVGAGSEQARDALLRMLMGQPPGGSGP